MTNQIPPPDAPKHGGIQQSSPIVVTVEQIQLLLAKIPLRENAVLR
jgi:hypothetical protein